MTGTSPMLADLDAGKGLDVICRALAVLDRSRLVKWIADCAERLVAQCKAESTAAPPGSPLAAMLLALSGTVIGAARSMDPKATSHGLRAERMATAGLLAAPGTHTYRAAMAARIAVAAAVATVPQLHDGIEAAWAVGLTFRGEDGADHERWARARLREILSELPGLGVVAVAPPPIVVPPVALPVAPPPVVLPFVAPLPTGPALIEPAPEAQTGLFGRR